MKQIVANQEQVKTSIVRAVTRLLNTSNIIVNH